MNKQERQLALDILLDIYRNQGYSNLSLAKLLPQASGKQAKQNAFITALVYGVIERDLTLEYLMNQYSKKSCDKLDIEIALILKMGFYQLLYLNSVPDNAAVDESVKLCYYAKKVSAKGFVNGVLRAFIRSGKKLVIKERDDFKSLSIAYSCPLWLVKKWADEYGYEETKKILQHSIGRPPLTIRVNTLKTTTHELSEKLKARGVEVCEVDALEDCLEVAKTGNIENLAEFQEGLFYVQDIASQLCVKLAEVKPNERVFDLCAAPGSKSFTMAQYMQEESGKLSGEILAFDLFDHKLELIEKTADKLRITNISVKKRDATVFDETLNQADCVLCDVPCGGLGIIRRKPEIKYKTREEISALPPIQTAILKNASKYVKTGGRLIYSTCSLNQEENEQIVANFLKTHPEFVAMEVPTELENQVLVREKTITLLPQFMNSDGFFIARFQRQ